MARNKKGLKEAIKEIAGLREEFWKNVNVVGDSNDVNQCLERAARVADYLELGELMALDALNREESCGGHFRIEYQTEDGEAARNDEKFMYVSAWEYKGPDQEPVLNKEPLTYENIKVAQRNYK